MEGGMDELLCFGKDTVVQLMLVACRVLQRCWMRDVEVGRGCCCCRLSPVYEVDTCNLAVLAVIL
jgi:hypothetical protein